jgi:hypothetical protein
MHKCADAQKLEIISTNCGLRSRYWSMGGASSSSFFVKAFYLNKLPSPSHVFPNLVSKLKRFVVVWIALIV